MHALVEIVQPEDQARFFLEAAVAQECQSRQEFVLVNLAVALNVECAEDLPKEAKSESPIYNVDLPYLK